MNTDYPKSFVAIDFETIGPKRLYVCQVGMAKYIDGKRVGTFDHLICPPPGATSSYYHVHDITYDTVRDAPTFAQLLPHMEAFVGDLPLVAHNGRNVEASCFRQNIEHYGLSTSIRYEQIIDTLPLARLVFPGKRNGLTAICRRYHIDDGNHHDAVADAVMCGEVYLRLAADLSHRQDTRFLEDDDNPPLIDKIVGCTLLISLVAFLFWLLGRLLQ